MAMDVINGNHENLFWKLFMGDPKEERYRSHAPEDTDLDLLIDLNMFGNDDAVINMEFELDIKD